MFYTCIVATCDSIYVHMYLLGTTEKKTQSAYQPYSLVPTHVCLIMYFCLALHYSVNIFGSTSGYFSSIMIEGGGGQNVCSNSGKTCNFYYSYFFRMFSFRTKNVHSAFARLT